MASYYLCPMSAFTQLFNDAGSAVLSGALIWTYQAGTTTPTPTWTDSTGGTPNSNPIQLGSNGRLNNVNIWQQGGVPIKVVFSTNAGTVGSPVFGVQIGPTFDQLSGINDPATTLASLANAASGSGADLVANAVRSYDVFAAVRAANVPNLSAGQTLVIDVEGASLVTDSGGGLFYWNATSTATDDGTNVLKPNALSAGSPGRYIRQAQSGVLNHITVTLNGVSGTVTATAWYYVIGNVAVMRIPQVNGTSNSTSFSISFPQTQNLNPAAAQAILFTALEDSGSGVYSQVGQIGTPSGGVVTIVLLKNGNSAGWTASGTKGIGDGGVGQYSNTITWLTA